MPAPAPVVVPAPVAATVVSIPVGVPVPTAVVPEPYDAGRLLSFEPNALMKSDAICDVGVWAPTSI